MSRNNFSIPPGVPALPPLPPLNNPIGGSVRVASDSPNLASVGNAHVESLADEFLTRARTMVVTLAMIFLRRKEPPT